MRAIDLRSCYVVTAVERKALKRKTLWFELGWLEVVHSNRFVVKILPLNLHPWNDERAIPEWNHIITTSYNKMNRRILEVGMQL